MESGELFFPPNSPLSTLHSPLLKKVAVFTIPTGIGAKIGGYAGDASLVAGKIAEKIPLIVNPNVVNAACFSGITENMLYVEGWAINEFLKGKIALKPSPEFLDFASGSIRNSTLSQRERGRGNKIGVIFDSAIPQNVLNIHINTINAVKTVYGIDILDYVVTEEPVGVEFFTDESGLSTGGINNPDTLLKAGQKLKDAGAQAIAVVCRFDEPENDGYETGNGVDVIGGVEGIISHYLSKNLMLPCVHAPAFDDVTIGSRVVSPKAAAEYITPTFLPCLFFGLQNAPQLVSGEWRVESGEWLENEELGIRNEELITLNNVKALITPADALGSSAVLDCVNNNIPVFAVEENTTVLSVDAQALGINVTSVSTYNDIIL